MTEEEKEKFKQLQKQAFKEGIKEWLDDRYRELGKYTARLIMCAVIAGLAYFLLWINGWHQK